MNAAVIPEWTDPFAKITQSVISDITFWVRKNVQGSCVIRDMKVDLYEEVWT